MRKVFYSFDYARDSHRVQQVKNMGVLEGQPILAANKWEEVEDQGDAAIIEWIDAQMSDKSCLVVLIGAKTAGRKWVKYEIQKAWESGKGVVGVYIHGLKDLSGTADTRGLNPFSAFSIDGTALSSIVKAYEPAGTTSTAIYARIEEKLADWVEEAIKIRGNYN